MTRIIAKTALVSLVLGFLLMPRPGLSQPKAPQVVTYNKLIDYLQVMAKEEILLKMIDDSPTLFTLSPDQEGELRKAGASDKVITAIKSKTSSAAIDFKPGDITSWVLILDCSGSMKDKGSDGETKWAAAQKAAIDLVQAIPEGRELSFIVYGHDVSRACMAVDTLLPMTTIDASVREKVTASIKKLDAVGHTPIARSLQYAGQELKKCKALSRVILITDGMETCEGDPEKEAAALTEYKLFTGMDVVGFDLKKEESDKVEAIAKKGRGKYYPAKTAKDLEKAMKVVAPPKEKAKEPIDERVLTPKADTKFSTNPVDPAVLELSKYVYARVGEKPHYWAIDLKPGEYKAILDGHNLRSPQGVINLSAQWCEVKNGQMGAFQSCCFVADNYSQWRRSTGTIKVQVPTRLIFKVSLTLSEINEYAFSIVPAQSEFSVPLFVKTPLVGKIAVGTDLTWKTDGNNEARFFTVHFPEGTDYRIKLTFESVEPKGSPIGGHLYLLPMDGDHHYKAMLGDSGNSKKLEKESKLILADGATFLIRVTDASKNRQLVTVSVRKWAE